MPCLQYSLTEKGIDSIEEGLDCITQILYYGYKDRPISPEMWKFLPQLMYICIGNEEAEAGEGYEFLYQVCIALKNFVSRDP